MLPEGNKQVILLNRCGILLDSSIDQTAVKNKMAFEVGDLVLGNKAG